MVRIILLWYAERDSFAFLPLRGTGKNLGSNQFLNWLQQYATGILRFRLFESLGVAKKQIPIWVSALMVRRKGLEPLTYWFVASHSIQLSYQRKMERMTRLELATSTLARWRSTR